MYQKIYLFLFFYLASYNSIWSQNIELDFISSTIEIKDSLQIFENYTIKNGLPDNKIYDIIEDKYGYLWLATGGGLSRFNGKDFKNYYHNSLNSTSISSNKVTRLVEDSYGDLWIGTANGLNKFIRKDETFKRFYLDKYNPYSLPGNNIRAMLADTVGVIWLETGNGFFSRLDVNNESFENYGHEPAEIYYPSHTIKKRKNGNIIILGRRIIPKEFNVKTKKLEEFEDLKNYNQHFFMSSFFEKSNGEFLFNNSATHSIITNSSISEYTKFHNLSSIYDVLEDSKGNLWLGGYKSGAIKYNLKKNKITRYKNSLKREESIISDFVLKTYEDKNGQIWFATLDGLSRLKSNQFIQHVRNEKGSNKITAIEPSEDAEHLWIATENQGLYIYNLKNKQYEKHIGIPELLSNVIQDIHLDKEGQLWIAQWQGKGFNILDTKTNIIKSNQLCNNPIYDWWSDILETKEGQLYLAAWGKGPIQVDKKSKDLFSEHWLASYYENLAATPILVTNEKLYFQAHGKISVRNRKKKLVSTIKRDYPKNHSCVYKYNPYVNYSPTESKWTISNKMWNVKLSNGEFLVTSKEGIYKVDTTDLQVRYANFNLPNDTIIDILEFENTYLLTPSYIKILSQNGKVTACFELPNKLKNFKNSRILMSSHNLFVTSSNHIQRYNIQDKKWDVIDFRLKENKLKETILIDNHIWALTRNHLYKISTNEFKLTEIKINNEKSTQIKNLNSLAVENDNSFWLGTDNGLFHINMISNTNKPYFNLATDTLSLPSDKILSLQFDTNKDLWVGTQNGIAYFNKNNNHFERYNHNSPDGLSSPLTTSMFEDSKGNIWVGNSGGSLDKVNLKDTSFIHFFKEPWNKTSLEPDDENNISCIYEDSKNRIWIGGASLSLFNEDLQNFTHYNTESETPFNSVKSITEDNLGNLWLGTNRGLFTFDMITKKFQHFGLNDNIQSLTFSKASCKLPDGRMILAGDNGFNIIDLNKRKVAEKNGTINLFNFHASDNFFKKDILADDKLELNHAQNTINLSVTLSQNNKGKSYRYKLTGYEKVWTTNSFNEDNIKYENLPPGEYILQVESGSIFDGWSEYSKKIFISISKPFWNTWWFFACTFIPFAILTFLIVNWQQKRILAQKEKDLQLQFMRIKSLQVQMNPHFIFNVLGSIQNLILIDAKEAASNSIVKLAKLIRSFLDSTVNMKIPINSYASDEGELPLSKEIELINMYVEFEQLQHNGQFSYNLTIEEGLIPSNYKIPPMILQPFVENAIKHGLLPKSTSGTLSITIQKLGEDGLELNVIDDGIGIKKSKEIHRSTQRTHQSYGLDLVQERVSILNQLGYEIVIHTTEREESGTNVNLKINRQYDNH